jgi:hypothetical protein
MAEMPAELLRKILNIISLEDWRSDPSTLQELQRYLLSGPFDWRYEFFGVPVGTRIGHETVISEDRRELILETVSLPFKAILVRDPTSQWKLAEFLGQCTGCLGSWEILGRPCNSCSGTGWGMRPS